MTQTYIIVYFCEIAARIHSNVLNIPGSGLFHTETAISQYRLKQQCNLCLCLQGNKSTEGAATGACHETGGAAASVQLAEGESHKNRLTVTTAAVVNW